MVADPVQVSGRALVGAAVVAAFLIFRLIRLSRASVLGQEIKLSSMWLGALVYMGLAGLVIALQPPQGLEWIWLALGVLLGAPVGWWRGKMIELKVNPVTGALTARTSIAAAAFFVGLIALKYGLRFVLMGDGGPLHLSVKLATITLLAFALGLVVAQRVEMTLRAAQLMVAASAAQTTLFPPPSMISNQVSQMPIPPVAASPARASLSTAQLIIIGVAIFALVVIVGVTIPR